MSTTSNSMPLHIILVWSPIGYETYLSLANMFGAADIILISARNFHPPQATAHLGDNHHYFSQKNADVESATEGLAKIAERIVKEGRETILYVPQCANFYVRTLIESSLVDRFLIYDEGDAAYEPNFSRLINERWNRGIIRSEPALLAHLERYAVSLSQISRIFKEGPVFYEVNHRKLSGFVSFFDSAFRGCQPILLNISTYKHLEDIGSLFIVPYLSQCFKGVGLRQFIEILHSGEIARGPHDDKTVVKFHPNDGNAVRCYISDILTRVGVRFDEWDAYCERNDIDIFREAGFLKIRRLLSPANSTRRYHELIRRL
jgi:hypothetical protein